MSREYFDPLPPGPVRLGRSRLRRAEQQVERSSRLLPPAFPGSMGDDQSGVWIDPEWDRIVYALITAQPGSDGSDTFVGYSWMQREPDADGGWRVPEVMLRGDNGSEAGGFSGPVTNVSRTSNVVQLSLSGPSGLTAGETITVDGLSADGGSLNGTFVVTEATGVNLSYDLAGADIPFAADSGVVTAAGRPAGQAAFDPNGADDIPVGSIVVLGRGYFFPAQEQWQWIIVGGGGISDRLPRVRVTGRPWCFGGLQIYPAVRDLDNAADAGFHDGDTPLWLEQRDGAPLDTRGFGVYTAGLKLRSYAVTTDVGDETRELWVTTESLFSRGAICNGDGTLSDIMSGVFEGCADGDFFGVDGEVMLVGGEAMGV